MKQPSKQTTKFHHQISREAFPNGHHPSISSHHRLLQDFPHDFQVMYSLWRGRNQMKHHETSINPQNRGIDFLWPELRSHQRIQSIICFQIRLVWLVWLVWLVSLLCWLRIPTWPLRGSCTAEYCWDIEMASCALLPVRSLPPWVGYEARRWTASCSTASGGCDEATNVGPLGPIGPHRAIILWTHDTIFSGHPHQPWSYLLGKPCKANSPRPQCQQSNFKIVHLQSPCFGYV